jgi:threonine synthase
VAGGAVVAVADDAIFGAWADLARLEGIFCEPASAAGLAALLQRQPPRGATVVCVVTGHGLKDPEAPARLTAEPISVEADPQAIAEAAK